MKTRSTFAFVGLITFLMSVIAIAGNGQAIPSLAKTSDEVLEHGEFLEPAGDINVMSKEKSSYQVVEEGGIITATISEGTLRHFDVSVEAAFQLILNQTEITAVKEGVIYQCWPLPKPVRNEPVKQPRTVGFQERFDNEQIRLQEQQVPRRQMLEQLQQWLIDEGYTVIDVDLSDEVATFEIKDNNIMRIVTSPGHLTRGKIPVNPELYEQQAQNMFERCLSIINKGSVLVITSYTCSGLSTENFELLLAGQDSIISEPNADQIRNGR